MSKTLCCWLLAAGSGSALIGFSGAVAAEVAPPAPTAEIVVTADRAGLLERRPNTTVLGLKKPLIETPRSASLVSDVTIQRYGIQTINDFVAISPSSYTASFYGVPGELNIRGTLAENYFQGFKLIENRGTYSTPIGDASQIDVVRGPPSAIYGPGKVGGFLNFIPKSVRTEALSHPVGEVEATFGGYGRAGASGQFGTPLSVGPGEGGLYAYGEIDKGGSFYEGIHPQHELGEVSLTYDLPGKWSFSADALVFHATGDVQTPGWNRLTQGLIDHQTYITGHNTTLSASPGAGYLTPDQASPGAFAPYPFNFTAVGGGLYAGYFGGPVTPPAAFNLDSPGAGSTVRLRPRNVFVSPYDFSKTTTPTVVLGLAKEMANGDTLKLQLFYNGLENQRFVSYGFPAWFQAHAYEARATYDFKLAALGGLVTADTVIGASYRGYQGRDRQSFNSGVIAVDRRDLSVGATPTDVICDPFTVHISGDQVPANCLGWENDVHSRQADEGAFVTTDIAVGKRLDLILGGRYDFYQVRSQDTGILPFEVAGPVYGSKGSGTYSASVSYKLGWGLMGYATYALDNALEVQQAGDLQPRQIVAGGFLSQSDLTEGGVKFQLLNKTLVGSIDAYKQNRTQLTGLNTVTQRTRSTGVEFEIRYLATQNLSLTLAGDSQHTEVLGPDASTEYIPAYAVCGANLACQLSSWGGAYLVFNFSSLPGRGGDYSLSSIPHSVVSLYANYISDEHGWGRAGATVGATYVSQTSGTIENAVSYPAYSLVNASAFYQRGAYEVMLNVDNLFDQLYFTPNSDPTYVNMTALPGVGREWRLTFKRKF